ncbi:hypothetical protein OIB37_09670 [Streptomyces sp. NBC_00820]|uniref:hypothetical protein n=1 Tax=Streptomyces sp. NBC_00820 TaxID=2975842 RepID=UPI002ED3203F|nr:hypothetical protein OIB37_09670 [Streptomyces sp. NBC_00820]
MPTTTDRPPRTVRPPRTLGHRRTLGCPEEPAGADVTPPAGGRGSTPPSAPPEKGTAS